MRMAMIRVSKKLEEIKESSCKILLQIHDELIFEVHKNDEKKYSKIIQDEMSSVKDSDLHSFSIPLLVDVNVGNNWGELH
jgi:DNA polymerase-1